jgi:hypothetical protein
MRDPLGQVRGTQSQPPVPRLGVGLIRSGQLLLQPGCRLVERQLRGGDPGAPLQVAGHRLPVTHVAFLGEPDDVRRPRRPSDRPAVRSQVYGGDAEQGGLADTVRGNDPDPVTGVNSEISTVQNDDAAEGQRDLHTPQLGHDHILAIVAMVLDALITGAT